MRTRPIGPHEVTALGSGNISLATSAARGVPARDLAHAINESIAFGVTLFDVSADADSEKLVGEVVRDLRARDRVVVATHVPPVAPRPGAPVRDALPERLPAAYVQARVEDSLRASRLDALPLVQLALRPAWRNSRAWPELAGTCARLIREGKVQAWGATFAHTAPRVGAEDQLDDLEHLLVAPRDEDDQPLAPVLHDDVAALIAEDWLCALALPYAVCDRRAEAVFAAAAARKLAILAQRPLAGGALTGRIGPGVAFPPRDDRNALAPSTLERVAVGVAKLAPLVKVEPPAVRSSDAARQLFDAAPRPPHRECNDVAELALRFAIDRAGIALPRLHRHDLLLNAIAAAAAPPLSDDVVARIVGGPREA